MEVSDQVKDAVTSAQSKALAELIVRLLNENESLLRAKRIGDGTQVIVEERGGPNRYAFAVVPSVPGSDS
jgi:hypothetical protein